MLWFTMSKFTNNPAHQSSVGDYPKSLHLVGAVIPLIQIHVQRSGIQDILLAFPAVEGLALRPPLWYLLPLSRLNSING